MKLIIAEKSDLGKNVAASIRGQNFKYKGGYLESEDYFVTWCAGHCYELYDLEQYLPAPPEGKKTHWTLDVLPFVPKDYKFKYKIKKTRKSQFGTQDFTQRISTISELANRDDVIEIYHCGDPDREGEVIVRKALSYTLKTDKPVYRLWLDDTSPETVNKALSEHVLDSEYQDLYNAGLARAYVDWLFGINLTRYLSLKANTILRTGRCKIAIVEKLVEREKEIKNFVPEDYFGVGSKEKTNGTEIELNSKKTFDKDSREDAEILCSKYNAAGAVVTEVTKERKRVPAKSLFNTSTLIGTVVSGNKSIEPKQIDEALESLYQKGYTTYPRTKSVCLTQAEADKVDGIISLLKRADSKYQKIVNKPKSKAIYDNSKVEGHSALIVTGKMPSGLTPVEMEVYTTILNRFLAVFCSEDRTVDRSTILIQCSDETFKLTGDVQVDAGWAQYEKPKSGDTILPNLDKGDAVYINFSPISKKTSPPKRFTVATFEKWCVAPWRKDESNSDEFSDDEWKKILSDASVCTNATRTATIEACCQSKYISIKKGTYYAEPMGMLLMDVVNQLGVNFTVSETMDLSKMLFEVSKGDKTIRDCLDVSVKKIQDMFKNREQSIQLKGYSIPSIGGTTRNKVICKCGNCGGNVVATDKWYYCSSKCGNIIGKKNKILGERFNIRTVSESQAKKLLSGESIPIKGAVRKNGKKYDCILSFDFEHVGETYIGKDEKEHKRSPGLHIEFPENAVVGKCPVCGGKLKEFQQGFFCENKDFSLWKETKLFNDVIKISNDMAKKLLSGNTIAVKLTSKENKPYTANMKMDGVKEYNGRQYPNLVVVDIVKNS